MDIVRIAEEIKSVNINEASMHPLEYQHIVRIFYGEIMENGWYGLDEVEQVLNELSYPQHTKDIINDIADIIQKIKDQPETTGRYPGAYKRVMRIN